MKKKVYLLALLATILILGVSTSAYATLKSVPGTSIYSSDHNGYFVGIRKMEAGGGILGLNATIDDLGQETSSSNNIDSHLLKETEYEAIQLLVNSQYGVQWNNVTSSSSKHILNTIESTTTKNASGIYDMRAYNYYYSSLNSSSDNYGSALASLVGNKDAYTGAFKEAKSRYLDIREGTPYGADAVMKIFTGGGSLYRNGAKKYVYVSSAYASIVNGSGV